MAFVLPYGKNGRIVAIRNGYQIGRNAHAWTASEGNGGIVTYKAMGAYATKLAKQDAIKVTLISAQRRPTNHHVRMVYQWLG